MPKRLRQQRRGKGKQVFRAPSFRFKFNTKFKAYDSKEQEEAIKGKVVDIINDSSRTAPTMIIEYEDGTMAVLPAPLGIKVGESVSTGAKAEPKKGNVLPLRSIPTGASIYHIELVPGDGGKFVKASGTNANVVTKEKDKVMIKLPSKAFRKFDADCRAVIGTIAGFGRKEKPIAKAGKNFHIKKSRGKYWPNVAGVAMNAVNHPHGGKRRSTQHTKTRPVGRNAPPGRKVGHIAPKRTGVRKSKKK